MIVGDDVAASPLAKNPVPMEAFAAEPVSTTSILTTCSENCLKISCVVAAHDLRFERRYSRRNTPGSRNSSAAMARNFFMIES